MTEPFEVSPPGFLTVPALAPNIYYPLRRGQIRLLERFSGSRNSTSFGTRTYDISSAPVYCALSYVCGDQLSNYSVLVNGQAFTINRNLSDALQRLSGYFRMLGTGWPLLWIDAISINQSNLDEKAEQVREMHRVFSGARSVLIWLGHAPRSIRMVLHVFRWASLHGKLWRQLSSGSATSGLRELREVHYSLWDFIGAVLNDGHQALVHELACNAQLLEGQYVIIYAQILALTDLLRGLRKFESHQSGSDIRPVPDNVMDADPALWQRLPRPDHAFWSAFAALPESEWCSRVWTFQEIQLASKATLLTSDGHVGWNVVRWSTFPLLKAYATGAKAHLHSRLEMVPPTQQEYLYLTQCVLRWMQFFNSERDPALCLMASGTRKAKLSKDHVYGVLGLWPEACSQAIRVDYKMADADVFTAAVKACLRHSFGAINTFWSNDYDLAKIRSPTPGLPSWCPDLRFALKREVQVWHDSLYKYVEKKYIPRAYHKQTPVLKSIGIRVLRLDQIKRTTSRPCPAESGSSLELGQRYTRKLMTWVVEMCVTFAIRNNDALMDHLDIGRQEVDLLYANLSGAEVFEPQRYTSLLETWNNLGLHRNICLTSATRRYSKSGIISDCNPRSIFSRQPLAGSDTLQNYRLTVILLCWCRIAGFCSCSLPMLPSILGVQTFMV